MAAEFSGARGLKEGLVEEGSRGTVGKPEEEGHASTWWDLKLSQEISVDTPVCSSLGMVGGAAVMDKPDSESSRLVGMTGAVGGGVTADSWT